MIAYNAINIQAQQNLPEGVSKIEIYDWTRTREPTEISNGEKKLNSYSTLSGFNKGISDDEIAKIDELYDAKLNLRSISLVSESESAKEDSEVKSVENKSVKEESVVKNVENELEQADTEDELVQVDIEASEAEKESVQTDTNIEEESVQAEENAPDKSIKGGKVLRTVANYESSTLRYNINSLREYLKSNQSVVWHDDKITWDLYTRVNENEPAIEWRLFSAKFNLTSEQLNMIKNSKSIETQMVLGISADNQYGFELMIPFNDIINVFINDKITSINYANRNAVSKYYFNDTLITYKYPLSSKCPSLDYHNSLSSHTGNSHLDTTGLNESDFLDTRIRENLKIGENNIDFLIGNIIDDENLLSTSNGFSKVNLYIIENPKVDIKTTFYTYHNGEIVYYNKDYLPKNGESVYMRIDIENNSDKIDVENLDLIMNVSRTNQIKVSAQKVTLDGKSIDVRCYINEDFSTEGYSISRLKNLNTGEKISIMSDDLKYTVTSNDCKTEYVYLVCNLKMNYITDKLKYSMWKNWESKAGVTNDTRIKIPVSKLLGSFTISLEVEDEDIVEVSTLNDNSSLENQAFLLNLVSSEDFVNMYILPGKTYKVEDVCLNLDYKINFVLPQNYEIVDTSSYSNSGSNLARVQSENTSKNIEIKIKKKKGSYFYKNDQKKITVDFLENNSL